MRKPTTRDSCSACEGVASVAAGGGGAEAACLAPALERLARAAGLGEADLLAAGLGEDLGEGCLVAADGLGERARRLRRPLPLP